MRNHVFYINFLRILKFTVSVITSILIVYFLAAIILSLLKTHPSKLNCLAEKEILITTNSIHVDIIVPAEDIDYELLRKLETLPDTKYIAFGFGDKEFYINTPEWKDLKFKTAFNALFLKSETALHVTCYFRKYESWKAVKLCNSQLDILNGYISDSFQNTSNGKLKKIDVKGYYKTDLFYEAKGSFSIFNTCNVWVTHALKETGVETAVWSPFDFGILWNLPE